jgi:hypothetical protein
MRKSFLSALFVVLAVLGQAKTANAQAIRYGYIPQTPEGWYYMVNGDQVGMLTADNLGMVRNLTNQLRASEIRSVQDDLIWSGSAYGLPTRGGFYPMYDRQMRPMGRREATITYGAIGAGIGYGVSGNMRGTVIGAAGGAILGILTHRGNGNNNSDNGTITTPPYQDKKGARISQEGIPVEIGTKPSVSQQEQPASRPPSSTTGGWRVSNRTSKRAELWDGEQFIARIEPWQSVQVSAPKSGYKAVLLIPNRLGGLSQETAQIRSSDNFNGWDILVPAVQ